MPPPFFFKWSLANVTKLQEDCSGVIKNRWVFQLLSLRLTRLFMCLDYPVCVCKSWCDFSKTREGIIPLLARLPLESCVQFWAPPSLQNRRCAGACIQRRGTKLPEGVEDKIYKEHLRELGLFTLETMSLRGELLSRTPLKDLQDSWHPFS